MDSVSSSLNNKKIKIQNLLLDLNKEISTAVKFILEIKDNSEKMIKNLNMLSSPSIFLKEFVSVNSYLFTYLNIFSEINCKFEMIIMSEIENKTKDLGKVNQNTVNYICSSSEANLQCVDSLETEEISKLLDDNMQLELKKINCKEKNSSFETLNEISSNEKTFNDNRKAKDIDFLNKISTKMNEQNVIESEHLDTIHKTSIEKLHKPSVNFSKKPNGVYNSDKQVIQQPNFNSCTQSVLKENITLCSDQLDVQNLMNCVSSSSENLTTQKNCFTKDMDIKPLNISRKIGEEFYVTVEHINSPSEFYVHIKNDDLNLLRSLEKKLKLFSPESIKTKCDKKNFFNEFGKYVLYYSKCEEVWCRAEVINWYISHKEDYVSIFLLDYGESKCVSFDSLQPLPDALKLYPVFAQKCHLYGVNLADENIINDSPVWGRVSYEEMRNLIENSNDIKIRVAPNDDKVDPSSLPVILFLADKENECINDLVVKTKHALQKLKNFKDTLDNYRNYQKLKSDENLENWNPMKEDFESYKNSYDLNINDPAAHIYGYVGKDYDRVCMQYSKTGNCSKGEACRKEHTHLDPSGYTTDVEEIYKNSFNSLPVPKSNEVLNIQITCILKLNKFCCIRENLSFDSNEENLDTLVEAINAPKTVRDFKKLLIPPSIGQIVLAQYSKDDFWYRGKILESEPENDVYIVLFVDYGNKESISLNRIRAIEPRFLHLPFQAIFCYISGIKPNSEVSETKAIAYLNKKLSENIISIKVLFTLPGEDLNLVVDVYDHNGENIGQNLIEEGYAVFKEEMLLDPDCKMLPG